MPRLSLASLTSKNDTESVIRDLVRTGQIDEKHLTILPEHFESRASSLSYHYCALCGTTLKPGDRLENHLSAKKGHDYDPKGKVALALINFSKGVMEKIKGASIDLDLIPDPETEAEQRIHRAYQKQLVAMGVPIQGKPKTDVTNLANLTKTLQTLVKTLKKEDTADDIRSTQTAPVQLERPPSQLLEDFEQNEPDEHIHQDEAHTNTHDPVNYIPRHLAIESINDNRFTGGAAVSSVFEKQPRIDLLFHHEADQLDPHAYVVDFIPKENATGWVVNVRKTLELWRKLSSDRHPLLKEYALFVGSLQSKDEKSSTAGVSAYPSYCARFALVAMRARQRYGETLSVDDILFSCAYLNVFFDRLKKEKVSVSVRMNFMKSIRHFIKWVEQFINPVWMTGIRCDMCGALKTRLRYVLTELKIESRKELAIQSVAREVVKKPVLYCVARALAGHTAIADEIKRIVNKVRNEQKDATHAEYNFVLGALFLSITVFNTSRNEACYKSINASFIESQDSSGQHIKGTGFLKIVEDNKKYYIASYPNPKQARGMRSRTSVLGGLIVLDERIFWTFTAYSLLKKTRFARLAQQSNLLTEPRAPYFLKYDGTPVDMYTTPWMMKTVLRIMNIEEDMSCNAIRHTTANMQFDDYVSRELSGGAHRDIAYTTGHQTDTQLRYYTDDHKRIGLAGFKKLEQLANDEMTANAHVVIAAIKTVQLTKKLKKYDQLIEEQENEMDDRSQILRDVDDSDEEEDRQIEDMQGELATQWDQNRVHGPKAKRRGMSSDDEVSSIGSLDSSSSEEQRTRKKPSADVELRSAGISEHGEQPVYEDSTYRGLMTELQLSDTSEIVDEREVITAAIRKHNAAEPDGMPKFTMKDADLIDFKRRRYHRPVQNFSWVAVKKRRDGQNGLFAKCDLPKGSIVVDYRGRTLSTSDHTDQLKIVTPAEAQKIKAYFFEHKFPIGRDKVEFGIEAHHAVYDGTVVLGRFLNHSKCCSNLSPRFHREVRGDKLEIYVYFESTRKIKAHEELLWNYGIHFGNMPWYHMCECKAGASTRADAAGPWELSAESRAELDSRGPSMSQSALAAPFALLPHQNPHRTLIQLTYASTDYSRLYITASDNADCSIALQQAHTVFTNNEIVDHSAAFDQQSDVHRILSIMIDQLANQKSAVLILKEGDGFQSSLAIVIGGFDLGMLIIYRESPRQFQTLTAQPARRGAPPIERLINDIPVVRPSVQQLEELIRNPQLRSSQLIQHLKRIT